MDPIHHLEDSLRLIQRAWRVIERAQTRITHNERVLNQAYERLLEVDARNADPGPLNLPTITTR